VEIWIKVARYLIEERLLALSLLKSRAAFRLLQITPPNLSAIGGREQSASRSCPLTPGRSNPGTQECDFMCPRNGVEVVRKWKLLKKLSSDVISETSLIFTKLHGFTSHETVLFLVRAVKNVISYRIVLLYSGSNSELPIILI
jgi:hypothetical protein